MPRNWASATVLGTLLALGVVAANGAGSAGDPALNRDARFAQTTPRSGNGGGSDSGVYLPPIAGAQSEIVGTVVADSGAGPSDFVVATVTDRGARAYYSGRTDEQGHFHLRLPALDGIASLLLFKHFDEHGQPDMGAEMRVTSAAAHLENTRALSNLPTGGPAIVEASTAYELGGNGQGLVPLHVRGVDPLDARVLLDGGGANVDTLAASDESVLARLGPATALGRHAISVESDGARSNAQIADVVTQRFSQVGALRTGEVVPVSVSINGLGNDPATVTFTVRGAAALADGRASDTIPVEHASATTEIRGEHAGQLFVDTVLDVTIAQSVAQEVPHTQERTPTPPPLHAPQETPTPVSHAPPATPNIYGHENENVPCRYHVADGYMEPTQGFWQDDIDFTFPYVLDRYRERDYPAYAAHYDLAANRPAVLAGVYHYQWFPGHADEFPNDRGHIMLSVESNCDWKNREQVRIEFAFYLGGNEAWSGVPSQRWSIPLHGYVKQNAEFTDYILTIPAPFGWPADSAAFTPASAGHYTLFARLQHHESASPSSPWVDVPDVKMTLNGDVVQTHGLTIHYLPLLLSPGGDAAALQNAANALSNQVAIDLPDLYPLPPSGGNAAGSALPGQVDLDANGQVTDLSGNDRITHPERSLSKDLRDLLGPDYHPAPTPYDYESAVMEVLANTFNLQAILEKGDRIVVLVSPDDFSHHLLSGQNWAAYTTWKKVIFAPTGVSYETIGHEIAHTLPWDRDQNPAVTDANNVTWMISECQRGYHNVSYHYAKGLRFIVHGRVAGSGARVQEDNYGVMAPAYANKYIEQCTSRHLTGVLSKGNNDPEVFVVRGYIAAKGGRMAAEFTPFYTMESNTDDTGDDATADLHVRVLGANGSLLREVSISPLFVRPDDPDSAYVHAHLIAFMSRIPYVGGAREIQLVSRRDGVLATEAMTSAPPVVQILAPAPGTTISSHGNVAIRWSEQSQSSAALSSVLDSTDNGKSYHALVMEQTGTSLRARLIGYGRHLLRVVVTDGSRSGEATTSVTVARP